MTTETTAPEATPSSQPQFKKRIFVYIALAFGLLWAAAITSQSYIFMGIAGFLSLLAAGLGFWAWRQIRRHRNLSELLQGAGESPEAREQALAKLSADPKADSPIHIIARAQLLANEKPAEALALLEPVDLKKVSPTMQDDFALLKSQLLLTFGRAKEARPLADYVNVDNPQRAQVRPMTVAIVAETWARTGSAKEANELLDSVDAAELASGDAKPLLLIARVFAHFGAGKKGLTRAALSELAGEDPNLLGRFIAPKSQVTPGLRRLARESFERHGSQRQRRPSRSGAGRGRHHR